MLSNTVSMFVSRAWLCVMLLMYHTDISIDKLLPFTQSRSHG